MAEAILETLARQVLHGPILPGPPSSRRAKYRAAPPRGTLVPWRAAEDSTRRYTFG
jgi:hypothetical protein